jgi:hypothetical protein
MTTPQKMQHMWRLVVSEKKQAKDKSDLIWCRWDFLENVVAAEIPCL